jgi:hypothetical protein
MRMRFLLLVLLALHLGTQAQVETPAKACTGGARTSDPKAFHLEQQVDYANEVVRGTEMLKTKMFEGASDIERYRRAVQSLPTSTRSLLERCEQLPRMVVSDVRFDLLQATEEADRLNRQAIEKQFVSTSETNKLFDLAMGLAGKAMKHFVEEGPMMTVRVSLRDKKARQMRFTVFVLPGVYFKGTSFLPRDDAALLDLLVDSHIDLYPVQNKTHLIEGSVRLPHGDRRIWLGPHDAYPEMASMVRNGKIKGTRALSRDMRDNDKIEEFEALRDLITEGRP